MTPPPQFFFLKPPKDRKQANVINRSGDHKELMSFIHFFLRPLIEVQINEAGQGQKQQLAFPAFVSRIRLYNATPGRPWFPFCTEFVLDRVIRSRVAAFKVRLDIWMPRRFVKPGVIGGVNPPGAGSDIPKRVDRYNDFRLMFHNSTLHIQQNMHSTW